MSSSPSIKPVTEFVTNHLNRYADEKSQSLPEPERTEFRNTFRRVVGPCVEDAVGPTERYAINSVWYVRAISFVVVGTIIAILLVVLLSIFNWDSSYLKYAAGAFGLGIMASILFGMGATKNAAQFSIQMEPAALVLTAEKARECLEQKISEIDNPLVSGAGMGKPTSYGGFNIVSFLKNAKEKMPSPEEVQEKIKRAQQIADAAKPLAAQLDSSLNTNLTASVTKFQDTTSSASDTIASAQNTAQQLQQMGAELNSQVQCAQFPANSPEWNDCTQQYHVK